jgi:hypothetical protein
MSDRGYLTCTNCGEYAGSDIADEIERLREALEYYAEGIGHSEIEDNGSVARAALKGQTK